MSEDDKLSHAFKALVHERAVDFRYLDPVLKDEGLDGKVFEAHRHRIKQHLDPRRQHRERPKEGERETLRTAGHASARGGFVQSFLVCADADRLGE